MTDKNDIPKFDPEPIETDLDKGNLEDIRDMDFEDGPSAYEVVMDAMSEIPKKKFKNTAFGRTLLLKNKTGKTIATGIIGIGSTYLPEPIGGWVGSLSNALITTQTGVPMEFLDMSLWQIVIWGLAFLVPVVVGWKFPALKEKAAWSVISERLDNVTDEVINAIDEDSEGGKKITRNELKAIIGSALKKDDQ